MAAAEEEETNSKTDSNQLNVQTFFELEECHTVISELQRCGCCTRCILRLLGVKRQPLFITPNEVMIQLMKAKQNDEEPSPSTDNNGETEPVDKEVSDSSSQSSEAVCSVCLGILQGLCDPSSVKMLADQVREADFGFDTFTMSMTLPLQLLIREHCIYLHLKSVFSKLYQKTIHNSIATIKEVFKWVCGPVMGNALDVKFHFKSPMEIMVTLTHKETEKELNKLLQESDNKPPRKKFRRGYNSGAINSIGRPVVLGAIKNVSDTQFKELFTCPPPVPQQLSITEVTCSYSAVFVAGRYNKYSRNLSQTPWLIEGQRKTESSMQEIICDPIQDLFKASDFKFSASGREDVDVRTLGRGRPFVVEVLNSRRPVPTQEELTALQKTINRGTTDARVRDLQCIEKDDLNKLKDGEEIKTKSYSALIWSSVEQTAESLAFLTDIKDLTLYQKTPVRVLHRRPLATRERVVHTISAKVIDANHFRLFLRTQAGTYIKEFVHGDFGRTTPNLGILLKCDVDILELDVESVDVDWPPYLPEEEDADEQMKEAEDKT
ncbi:tRNA pseudouridine synthase Pus10-like [Asterias amurensis]|uniref:tRNA pseudouridine synthase Pus10-like n=1 Tax=Asterias amurensis TaxID=7602 RepID=UPI003AB86AA1